MQATKKAAPVASAAPTFLNENQIANAIGMSVHWVRKDRRGGRILPHTRCGKRVLYSLERVQAALLAGEEGGNAHE